jgi:hypothetical protein
MKNSTYSRRSEIVSTVKQVAGDDPGGLLAQERPPGGGRWPRCRVQPVTLQRRADRGGRDLHAQAQQLALDALVAPARVLVSQADDQLLDAVVERRSSLSTAWVGPGAGNQAPMPAQQRLWLHEEARPAGAGQHRLTAASSARSPGSSLGRGGWRRSTASWWRSTKISKSLAASPRASGTRSWMKRHSVM